MQLFQYFFFSPTVISHWIIHCCSMWLLVTKMCTDGHEDPGPNHSSGCSFCKHKWDLGFVSALWSEAVNMNKHWSVICALTLTLCIFVNFNVCWAAKPGDKWIVKPGACPRRTWGVGMCAEYCSSDSECKGALKCCSNGCGHECMEPYKVKRGRCPPPQPTQMCAEYCHHDGQCPEEQKCCRTSCGHACSEVQPC
uniref:WAP four-disulfide core domain 2 n=1 Tax=Neogobius melanostomus TaxID=47308 RepID=A0A8C6UCQ9_9GOBI